MKPNQQFFDDTHREISDTNRIARQQFLDAMMITLHEKHGFGMKRVIETVQYFEQVEVELATMVVDDAKCDKKMIYAKDKTDQRLGFMGEGFPEFDDRYGFDKKRVHVHTKKRHGRKKK